jgi:hypothetical protein
MSPLLSWQVAYEHRRAARQVSSLRRPLHGRFFPRF